MTQTDPGHYAKRKKTEKDTYCMTSLTCET